MPPANNFNPPNLILQNTQLPQMNNFLSTGNDSFPNQTLQYTQQPNINNPNFYNLPIQNTQHQVNNQTAQSTQPLQINNTTTVSNISSQQNTNQTPKESQSGTSKFKRTGKIKFEMKRLKRTYEEEKDQVLENLSKKQRLQELPPEEDDEIKMVIVHNDPTLRFKESEANKVQQWILDSIDLVDIDSAPQFTDCSFRSGFLYITCSDEASRKWLENLLAKKSPWPGAKLALLRAQNFATTVRAETFVPGPPSDPAKIIARIGVQNKGICTDGWKVVRCNGDAQGQHITVSMDEQSWKDLERLNYNPHVNFTRIKFRLIGSYKSF